MRSGNLYGTTLYGGTYDPYAATGGTVFRLIPPSTSGGNWTKSILWSFDGTDGVEYPAAGLIMDAKGNLYGTAGTIFELTPPTTSGGNWTESIVFDAGSEAGLIADRSGNLYGTTQFSGAHGEGTVFEISNIPSTPPTPMPTATATPTANSTPALTTTLNASPATLNFGKVDATGTSSFKKVTLTNKGKAAALISSVTATAPFMIGGGANTCTGTSIAPKKRCAFDVEFAPMTVANVTGGSIDVTYNGTSPAVALEGNGIAVILAAPVHEIFSPVTKGSTGKPKTIKISNPAAVSVDLGATNIGGTDPGAFKIRASTCTGTLVRKPGGCVITMEFTPVSARPARSRPPWGSAIHTA